MQQTLLTIAESPGCGRGSGGTRLTGRIARSDGATFGSEPGS